MALLTASTAFVVVAILLVFRIAYLIFVAPLSRLPGPQWAKISRLWLMYHEFRGDRCIIIDQLHQKYGPVVRIAPDEVAFNSEDAVKDIYGMRSTLMKSDFYDLFVYYNERNTFTSMTKQAHSESKRMVNDKYTKSYVMQPEVSDKIAKHAANFMANVRSSPVLDVYMHLHYFAMDVITGHLYGRYGTTTLTNPEHRPLVYDLSGEKHRTRLYLEHYFGGVMALITSCQQVLQNLGNRTTSAEHHVRGARLNAYGKDSISNFHATELPKDQISACSRLFNQIPGNENKIAAECMDHLVAGVDTTGDAMCILMWKLSTPESRHIQDQLFAELDTIRGSFDKETMTAPIAALDSLPFLDAVIREGLRWRAPVPMTLFRVVPPGPAKDIAGASIPAGTLVGCQAYSLHRIEDVFPDPDAFLPERWLTGDKQQLAAMRRLFWPFSSGARHCLGHNIAMIEMKMIIAAVYMHYTTLVTAGVTEESMRMDDQLTSGVPYGLSCVLEFTRRS